MEARIWFEEEELGRLEKKEKVFHLLCRSESFGIWNTNLICFELKQESQFPSRQSFPIEFPEVIEQATALSNNVDVVFLDESPLRRHPRF